MSETPKITASSVLAMLSAGKTRPEIQEHYGLNGVQMKQLFQHPILKGKKTIKEKGAAFIFVDDTVTSAPVANPQMSLEEGIAATQPEAHQEEPIQATEEPAQEASQTLAEWK